MIKLTVTLSELFGFLSFDSSQVMEIRLISHQHNSNVLVSIVFELVEPFLNALKCLLLCDVVNEQGTNGSSIISTRDSSVPLLPCSVPDLSFDDFAIALNTLRSKLNTNRCLTLEVEFILGEP